VSYLSSITDTLAKLKVPEKLFTAGTGVHREAHPNFKQFGFSRRARR
jgi:hypothetical protein